MGLARGPIWPLDTVKAKQEEVAAKYPFQSQIGVNNLVVNTAGCDGKTFGEKCSVQCAQGCGHERSPDLLSQICIVKGCVPLSAV